MSSGSTVCTSEDGEDLPASQYASSGDMSEGSLSDAFLDDSLARAEASAEDLVPDDPSSPRPTSTPTWVPKEKVEKAREKDMVAREIPVDEMD